MWATRWSTRVRRVARRAGAEHARRPSGTLGRRAVDGGLSARPVVALAAAGPHVRGPSLSRQERPARQTGGAATRLCGLAAGRLAHRGRGGPRRRGLPGAQAPLGSSRTARGPEDANAAGGSGWQLVNRIAIEDLEAWYFGDWAAVLSAYPRVPAKVPRRQGFRDPDAIVGGTWEAFERVMQAHGYFKGGLLKIEAARAIGAHVDPARSSSRSFVILWDAIAEACS